MEDHDRWMRKNRDEPVHHPEPAGGRYLRLCGAGAADRHRGEGGDQEVSLG